MVSVLASSVVARGFEFRSDQTKDFKIDMCCFSAKHGGERANAGWLGITIVCPSKDTCLSASMS